MKRTCPECQLENIPNTLFCERCGHDLRIVDDDGSLEPAVSASESPQWGLYVLPNGPTLSLPGTDLVLLGRGRSTARGIRTIDLTTVGGLEAGVSRKHALLQRDEEGFTLEDLGSKNGTRLNGKPITAHEPISVEVDDVIRLGQLALQLVSVRP